MHDVCNASCFLDVMDYSDSRLLDQLPHNEDDALLRDVTPFPARHEGDDNITCALRDFGDAHDHSCRMSRI